MAKPNWVTDHDLWAKAVKKIEDKEGTPQAKFSGPQHGMAAAEYKKLGGHIGGKKNEECATVDQVLAALNDVMPE